MDLDGFLYLSREPRLGWWAGLNQDNSIACLLHGGFFFDSSLQIFQGGYLFRKAFASQSHSSFIDLRKASKRSS